MIPFDDAISFAPPQEQHSEMDEDIPSTQQEQEQPEHDDEVESIEVPVRKRQKRRNGARHN